MKLFKDYKIQIALFLGLFYLAGLFIMDNWKSTMRNGDSSGYYIHNVSFFINHDVGDYGKTLSSFTDNYPKSAYLLDDPYWIKETKTGKKFIKYSIGVAVMETPAFLLAHLYARLSKQYHSDGFSKPYIFSINLIQIIYIGIGFYFLALVLSKYFPKHIVVWTLLSIGLGTNLFIQATYLTIAHTFLFFNFSCLIYLSDQFYRKPTYLKASLIGLLVGLIALIRVPEIIASLIPLTWGVYNRKTLLNRMHFIKEKFALFFIAALVTVLVFFPQLFYWHYVSGEWFFNPYQGEGFNFLEPHIYKGWLSYQNGWLVYAPIMFFSLLGIFLLKRENRVVLLPIIFFVGLNTYVHYSYYTWNYYPGMGSRPMIESYPLLAFSFAAFLIYVFKHNIFKFILYGILIFLMGLNLMQSWQFRQGVIWTARSNKAFYWESFGKLKLDRNSLRAFDSKEFQPREDQLSLVKNIYYNDYESPEYVHVSSEHSKSGDQSLLIKDEFPDTLRKFSMGDVGAIGGDYIFLSVNAFRKEKMDIKDRDGLESLVLRIYDENNKEVKWTHIKIASHIDNPDNKIGEFQKIGSWDNAGFFIRIPFEAKENWSFDALIWNPNHYKMYIDDFKIDLYRRK